MHEVDALTVHVLVDNMVDMLSTRPEHVTPETRVLLEAGMQEIAGQALCCAQHGLSLAVTARVDGEQHGVLFDAGPDPYTLERNVDRMGLDLRAFEAVVLSHGHFDHSEGLLKAAELLRRSDGRSEVPLHVHPGAFVKRAMRLPDGRLVPMQDVPARAALESAGVRLVETSGREELLGGAFLLSGEIPRSSFERGLETQVRRTASGEWEPDPLVMEERFMVAHVRGKGLAIFTGCSHAGIVNVCRHARELAPGVPLYALVGGLHLVYPNEAFVEETIDELESFGFKVIVPGHCTGWRAVFALLQRLGEDIVQPLAAGCRISL